MAIELVSGDGEDQGTNARVIAKTLEGLAQVREGVLHELFGLLRGELVMKETMNLGHETDNNELTASPIVPTGPRFGELLVASR